MTEESDGLKTEKTSLKKIIRKNIDYGILFDCITRATDLYTKISFFLRSYILYLFKEGKDLPTIDKDFIIIIADIFSKKEGVRGKPKRKTDIQTNLTNFYYDNYLQSIGIKITKDEDNEEHKVSKENISFVMNELCNLISINYKNNIKLNYHKYVKQYINQCFKKKHDDLIILKKKELMSLNKTKTNKDKLNINNEIGIYRKELNQILRVLKNDVIPEDGTTATKVNSINEYKTWLDANKNIMLPLNIEKNLYDEIKTYPFKFLKNMLMMNKYLEKNNLKTFQPLPTKSGLNNIYIPIDTTSLINIFVESGILKLINDIPGCRDELWEKYFNIPTRFSKLKKDRKYVFNYKISTDGVGVSISLTTFNKLKQKDKKSKNNKEKRAIGKEKIKDLTDAEKNNIKDNKKKKYLEEKIEKLDIDRKNRKIKKQEKKEEPMKTKKKKEEYFYIDDLPKSEENKGIIKEAIENKNIVYIDPGKRSLLMMYNGTDYLDVSNRWILWQTKRLKNNEIINKSSEWTILKNGKTLDEINKDLANKRSKTIDYNKYMDYVKIKLETRELLKEEYKYNNLLLTKKWNGYVNRKRNDSIIIKRIKKTYGEHPVLVLGDWSCKGNIKYISTPNMKIKKKLKKHFNLYLIDEFRTSKLHHKEEQECENLWVTEKLKKKIINGEEKKEKEVNYKLHSVLTCKMRSGYKGCINRDKNAVKNMKKITETIMETGKRPEKYRRETKLNKPRKRNDVTDKTIKGAECIKS